MANSACSSIMPDQSQRSGHTGSTFDSSKSIKMSFVSIFATKTDDQLPAHFTPQFL